MARIPDPQPGYLVISYAYLWQRDATQGRDEGTKYRPAVVVLAVESDDAHGDSSRWQRDATLVVPSYAPHRKPDDPAVGVEIPPLTKRRLGLDAERSWVIVSEVNRFEWPGPDLLPIAPGQWAYGIMPAGLFRNIRDGVVGLARQRKFAQVRREP